MSTATVRLTTTNRELLTRLFSEKPPVLVEVRFPNMGTSSDWFLCELEDNLDAIVERLAPGVEVHVNSVWDLRNPGGAFAFKK